MQSIQGDATENAHSLDYFYNELWFGKLIYNKIGFLLQPSNSIYTFSCFYLGDIRVSFHVDIK